jgi:hypothetical protein
MMFFLGYIGAVLTGFSLGLIGGGGSILIVPVLVYLFGVPPALATAYSLFIVGLASVVGAVKYSRAGLVDYKTAAIFAAPAFIGVFLARRFLVPAIPEQIAQFGSFALTRGALIMLVFAVVMLFASVSMIRRRSGDDNGDDNARPVSYNFKMIGIEGLVVGGITGFVGAGGGFLIIPALVLFARLPMKLAIGTSLVIIAAKSLLGFLGDLGGSQAIDWAFLLQVSGVAMAGIFLGTYVSRFIPGKKLQPAFGWFVLVMGVYIIVKQVL